MGWVPAVSSLLATRDGRQAALCRGAAFRGVSGPPTFCSDCSQARHRRPATLGAWHVSGRAAAAGMPVGPGLRRTPGLRREELATLAGVSIDYYTRLERGKECNPSQSVIDALARSLQLGEA